MLTDKECRAAKGGAKPFKLADAHGLHLFVSTTSFKSWRLKYRFGGREKVLTFGPYPAVKLADAREMSAKAREMLRQGSDPGAMLSVKAQKNSVAQDLSRSFEKVARDWHSVQKAQWKPRHADDVLASMETDLFPKLGSKDLSEIKTAELASLLRKVQDRGAAETAFRLLQRISAVYRFARACELVEHNPAETVADALQPVVKRKRRALLTIERAREFLIAFEAARGFPATKLASRLLALTAARPGTIRLAEAHEFEDLDGQEPIWRVPAAKLKLKLAESQEEAFDFIIPLSWQAVETVKAAKLFAGRRKYLFPSTVHSHRAITDNSLNQAYRALPDWGGKHVPHGWRASFSTIMNERSLTMGQIGDRQVIDLMLAHVQQGVEARYNRAAYMPRRRQLAQEWADLLCVGLASLESLVDLKRR
ncbi:integrase arm-type DNA-binding domain-containing protein [Novosphingobium sp.]|uniref:tyrosine-type recombinase/integrase n=1 Tax=Novosphingobium sp. TaxID=1874826 RepID=UPI0031DD85B2